MTEGNGHRIDPDGEARRALQAAVAEHGREVLSNPVVMDGVCRDRLARLPGESVLIGSAARSDVPALLRERAAALGLDEAIQSVAVTVAAGHGLNTASCAWVVREFAQALGYTPAGFTDQGDPLPPGPAAATSPAGQPPSRRRGANRNILGVVAAVALVAIYLAVAATVHLSPFGGRQAALNSPQPVTLGSSPNGSPDAAADTSPDVSPDPAPDPDPDPDPDALNSTLLSLIPNDIQSGGSCSDYGTPYGATAAIECTGVPGLAAGTLDYYLFAGTSTLSQGYDSFLQGARFPYTCTASDGSFENFITSCQSDYTDNATGISGVLSEYIDKDNAPAIACTDNQQLVMTVMIGANGNDLLAFWNNLGWIAAGS